MGFKLNQTIWTVHTKLLPAQNSYTTHHQCDMRDFIILFGLSQEKFMYIKTSITYASLFSELLMSLNFVMFRKQFDTYEKLTLAGLFDVLELKAFFK